MNWQILDEFEVQVVGHQPHAVVIRLFDANHGFCEAILTQHQVLRNQRCGIKWICGGLGPNWRPRCEYKYLPHPPWHIQL